MLPRAIGRIFFLQISYFLAQLLLAHSFLGQHVF